LVHASRGKSARAEPVALLYEAGKIRHAGAFPALEDELCGLQMGGGYEGPGRSPDRADALVWGLTELLLGGQGEPGVRGLGGKAPRRPGLASGALQEWGQLASNCPRTGRSERLERRRP
jgi:hypothetical protein